MENKKTEKRTQLNYTLILHGIRKQLDLSLLEYCIADSIYHLSNNPKSKIQGWCFASKDHIANFLGTTRQTIFDNLNKLIEKKLIEKDENTKYLRTTEKWYEKVVLIKMKDEYQETLHIVKKDDTSSKKTLHPVVKKPYTYNNSYSNIDNDITKVIEDSTSYGNKDINEVFNFLKEKLGGTPDGSQKDNRRFANLLINRFKKDYPDKIPKDLICALIEHGLKDKFHGKNITNFKYLYYNAQKIVQTLKSNKNQII